MNLQQHQVSTRRGKQTATMRNSNSTNNFPISLYRLLEDCECNGQEDVVSWIPESNRRSRKSSNHDNDHQEEVRKMMMMTNHHHRNQHRVHFFKVHNIPKFCETVMPKYFNQTKYKSFLRQLNFYGFGRVNSGPNRGSYWHRNFRRGRLDLCYEIKRIPTPTNSSTTSVQAETSTRTATGTVEATSSTSATATAAAAFERPNDGHLQLVQGSLHHQRQQHVMRTKSSSGDGGHVPPPPIGTTTNQGRREVGATNTINFAVLRVDTLDPRLQGSVASHSPTITHPRIATAQAAAAEEEDNGGLSAVLTNMLQRQEPPSPPVRPSRRDTPHQMQTMQPSRVDAIFNKLYQQDMVDDIIDLFGQGQQGQQGRGQQGRTVHTNSTNITEYSHHHDDGTTTSTNFDYPSYWEI